VRATWALLLGLASACDGTSVRQPPHPPFKAVKPPAVNPLREPRPAPDRPEAPPSLPSGGLPAFLVLRGGRPFEGEATVIGRLALAADRIVVTPEEGEPLSILYRLPKALPPPTLDPGSVRAQVRITGGPAGAEELVLVGTSKFVVFAVVRRSSAAPIRVDLGDGSSLVQSLAEEEERPGYQAVALTVERRQVSSVAVVPMKMRDRLMGWIAVVSLTASRRFAALLSFPLQHESGYFTKGLA